MKRRRIRKYRAGRRNSGMKFLWIIGIIIVAIIAGYITTRFIIGPMLGYDTEVLKFDFPSNVTGFFNSNDTTATVEKKTNVKAGNYALQYGVFSDKKHADKVVEKLKEEKIEAEIVEDNSKYKVISDRCDTKEAALEKLKNVPTDKVESVFITPI